MVNTSSTAFIIFCVCLYFSKFWEHYNKLTAIREMNLRARCQPWGWSVLMLSVSYYCVVCGMLIMSQLQGFRELINRGMYVYCPASVAGEMDDFQFQVSSSTCWSVANKLNNHCTLVFMVVSFRCIWLWHSIRSSEHSCREQSNTWSPNVHFVVPPNTNPQILHIHECGAWSNRLSRCCCAIVGLLEVSGTRGVALKVLYHLEYIS